MSKNNIKLNITKYLGFCFGVNKAVDLALELSAKYNKVYTYGKLIHNKFTLKELEKNNIITTNNIDSIKNDECLLIRAHGVPPEVIQKIKEKDINFYDATCVFVKRIHNIVLENYQAGKQIIIIGNSQHPEVIGINGYCDNKAIIIDEIPTNIDFDNKISYVCVVQTTYDNDKLKEIYKYIINKIKLIEFYNTICYTTIERQKEAEEIAKKSDLVFIIGDKESSNTNKLLTISKKYCKNSYLISSVQDLSRINLKKINQLGILAGASTSRELILEVVMSSGGSLKETGNVAENNNNSKMDELINLDVKSFDPKPGKVYEMKVNSCFASEGYFLLSLKDTNINGEAKLMFSEISLDSEKCNEAGLKKDEIIKVYVEKTDNGYQASGAKYEKDLVAIEELKEAISNDKDFAVKIKSVAPKCAGLLATIGASEVFIPSSHIELKPVKRTEEKLSKYIGKELKVKFLPDKEIEEQKEEKSADIVTEAPVETVEQKSTKTKNKEINYKNIKASRKLYLESERQKKEQLFWQNINLGDVVIGKTVRFTEFGAFVKVLGKDCLARINDLSWTRIDNPADVLELNKEYQFLVMFLDQENNKVNLGYKQLQPKPIDLAIEKYPVNSIIKGKVRKIFPFGMFVSIENGVDGLVPVNEVANEYIQNLTNYKYKENDEVEVKVINIDDGKFTLSIKELLVNKSDESDDTQEESAKKKYDKFKFDNPTEKTVKQKSKKSVENKEEVEYVNKSDECKTTIGDIFAGLAEFTDKK